MNDNPHIGESFESFLCDEGIALELVAGRSTVHHSAR
jgi:hypothetical protein